MKEYRLIKIGKLSNNRLKSMSLFKSNLQSFGLQYSFFELKELFDMILSGNFDEVFDDKFKYCLDKVFIDNHYEETIIDEYLSGERNFPDNYIPPFANN